MSYEPTIWKTGDIVSSEKLNKLEEGVANSGGGSDYFLVYIQEDYSTETHTLKRAGNLVDENSSSYKNESVTVASQAEMFDALKNAIYAGKRLLFGQTIRGGVATLLYVSIAESDFIGGCSIDFSASGGFTSDGTSIPGILVLAHYHLFKRDNEDTVTIEEWTGSGSVIKSATSN